MRNRIIKILIINNIQNIINKKRNKIIMRMIKNWLNKDWNFRKNNSLKNNKKKRSKNNKKKKNKKSKKKKQKVKTKIENKAIN